MEEGSEEEDAQIRVHVKYKIQIKREKGYPKKKPWVPPPPAKRKKKKKRNTTKLGKGWSYFLPGAPGVMKRRMPLESQLLRRVTNPKVRAKGGW